VSKDNKVIRRGPLKTRKITFASTDRVDEFGRLASEFMEEIFELLPGEYLISDESDIRDFTDFGSSDTSDIWKRIKGLYGFEQSDVGSGRFVNIFAEIAQRRNIQ